MRRSILTARLNGKKTKTFVELYMLLQYLRREKTTRPDILPGNAHDCEREVDACVEQFVVEEYYKFTSFSQNGVLKSFMQLEMEHIRKR